MSRLVNQFLGDTPWLQYPAVAIALFGLAAVLITITTFSRKRQECDALASLPLHDEEGERP
jgi:hypothetical protein